MTDELDKALNPHPFEKVITEYNSVLVTLTHGPQGRGAEVDAYVQIAGELVDLNKNLDAVNTSLKEGGEQSAKLARGAN